MYLSNLFVPFCHWPKYETRLTTQNVQNGKYEKVVTNSKPEVGALSLKLIDFTFICLDLYYGEGSASELNKAMISYDMTQVTVNTISPDVEVGEVQYSHTTLGDAAWSL